MREIKRGDNQLREPVKWFAEQMELKLREHTESEIISEAADVANFAMMIADRARER